MTAEIFSTDKSAPADRRSAGPLDVSEVREVKPYVDFGSIRIQSRDGLEMRLEIEEATSRIVAVSIDYASSSLQLQAFAAPKNEGVWHEIRSQMKESIAAQGGQTQEQIGSLGPELISKIPLTDESGNLSGHRLARFIGVDGPKWFLRGVVGGAALTDPRAAADIDDLFRSVVVVRDDVPIPPKNLLPLTLPAGTVAQPRVSS